MSYTGVQVEVSYTGVEVEVSYTGVEVEVSYTGVQVEVSYTGAQVKVSYTGVRVEVSYTGEEQEVSYAGVQVEVSYTGVQVEVSYTGPAHQGRGPPRFRSLRRRGTTQPGCSSSGRHEPSPGRGPLPLCRHQSLRSRPGTASPPFARRSATQRSSDSIVRHVRATVAKGKVHTRCLPGARVLDVSAQVPTILKSNIGAVVLHAGTNDIRLRQTEILKKDFRSLVEKVRTTSPTTRIIVSGPLPTFQRGIERFSRLFLLLMNGYSHGVKIRNYPLLIIGIFSGSVLGSTILMACTQAELEQQSSQTTSPGHYAPSD
ncbi:hypothetical protein QTP70_028120, partial [Hemibagrus guttatus]